jgi:hypothetical protein
MCDGDRGVRCVCAVGRAMSLNVKQPLRTEWLVGIPLRVMYRIHILSIAYQPR